MRYKISGEIAQQAIVELNPQEWLWAANSSLVGYTRDINWSLRVPGGFEGALKRSFAGEGTSLTYIESRAERQRVLLAANQPGKVIEWDLQTDGPIIATRGAFLAAWGPDIDINVTVAKRAGAAIFGGAGLFLQKISGIGKVLVHGSGDFFQHNLGAGEELTVSTGNLAAFAASVDYNIRGVGGCRKMLFSGE
ncbi:MAG: AIM24 family protein, partial [Chloroflexota bacterium]